MKKIPCLILEDEPLAAEVLQDYSAQVPFLDLRATCRHAVAAMEILQSEPIGLLFVDIHLPKMDGLAFLKLLPHRPHVILTTAYQEFALQGYELSVVDYLLKPVEWSRFLLAVNKVQERERSRPVPAEVGKRHSVFFNVNKRQVRVYLDEVLYIESTKDYIRIVTPAKTILTRCPLQQIEDLLAQRYDLSIELVLPHCAFAGAVVSCSNCRGAGAGKDRPGAPFRAGAYRLAPFRSAR